MIVDFQRYLEARPRTEARIPRRPEGKLVKAAGRFARQQNGLPPAA